MSIISLITLRWMISKELLFEVIHKPINYFTEKDF